MLHWGRPRLTADIDVTVLLGATRTARLIEAMQEAGFDLRVEGTPASQWPLDLVLGGPGLEEEFVRRAVPVEVAPGLHVPVISAEDLIVTKVLAARSKDLDDVRGIVAASTDLDIDAVRVTLAMLEEALGVSDLVPIFDRIIGP